MALADLIRPRTREQVIARMLTAISNSPNIFEPTSYLPGGSLRTLVEIQAEAQADTERTVAALAAGGYLESAAGQWLDALVASHYGIARQPSGFAQGTVTMRCLPLSGPYELAAGTAIVGTLNGLRYTSTASVTVPAGGMVEMPVQAEAAGSGYNVPGNNITLLHTPQPGLSVTNAANWLTVAGVDQESDTALRTRARLRWAERGGGATADAYRSWALSADPAVDQVRILDEHPRGQGTVDVVIWGSGGIGTDVVARVNAYIQYRRPLTADVQVYSAIPRTLTFTLELYAPGADAIRVRAEVLANLAALQQAASIGGTLYRSEIIEAAMLPAGVLDARPGAEVPEAFRLAPTEALLLAPTLVLRAGP
ncbi:baseplate J/gp47 family protein [Deinococcus sp. Arct2-2]|uniref:baseplate J/gp47 family protein n=1 Tax=Deinococcus sp. Arct2-2 TaxID=2568653 RepID=UPI001454C35F|nr:baseplate J/gp47 family protein [Deinococcus sp. Arct2-2]